LRVEAKEIGRGKSTKKNLQARLRPQETVKCEECTEHNDHYF